MITTVTGYIRMLLAAMSTHIDSGRRAARPRVAMASTSAHRYQINALSRPKNSALSEEHAWC